LPRSLDPLGLVDWITATDARSETFAAFLFQC
jgi:hypothetical protein